MRDLPTGTVTFLLTDVEGSTRLWEQHPEQMRQALARHDALAAAIVDQHEGLLLKSRGEGDSLFAVFPRATDALAAACALQQAYCAEPWPAETPLPVRMALHTGEADLRDFDYHGSTPNRCARLRATAHGGQVLLSLSTEELVRDSLPAGTGLRNLGEHRLRDLHRPEHVFQLLHPSLPADFAALRSLDLLPNNLPQQVTSFIGRELETADVKRLLAATRLLTLTGSGGCGKTRLALHVAADLLDEYPDGVWLVELAPLADPDLVPQAAAQALSVKGEPGKSVVQAITGFLQARRLLLILDNCEHVLDACARLVETLLQVCPGVKVLASSREGLGLAGEQSYRVPSLSLPDPKRRETAEELNRYEAVRLFSERAKLSRPDFAVTNQDAPALSQLCHRLDGIPLAIELAAARTRSLSVEEINAKLDNRFRLLTGGSRTALPRQQTLRALIDWSYDLLNPQEKALLHRLSVFSGGWTLEAAEQICAGDAPSGEAIEEWEALDLLTGLVDKSLALAETREGHTRYRLLETVRQYARERLLGTGEAETVRGRHCDHFLALVHTLGATHSGEEWRVWYRLVEREYDNVRAALDFCLGDSAYVEAGLRVAVRLHHYWRAQSLLAEGYSLLASFLSRPEAQRPSLLRAQALLGAAQLALWRGEYTIAIPLLEEALPLARQHGDGLGVSDCLSGLGGAYLDMGQPEHARPFYEEGLVAARGTGVAWRVSGMLAGLSNVCRLLGECEAARRYAGELFALADRGSDWFPHLVLANALVAEGRLPEARECYLHSLSALRAAGEWDRIYAASVLERRAALDVRAGKWEQAARLLGACAAYRDAIQTPVSLLDHADYYDAALAGLRTAGDADAFTAAWEKGRQMTFSQAVEYALGSSVP